MKLRKNLELIEVEYKDGKKAVMTFLDEENGEVLEVNFNRQSYDGSGFVDDPDKAKQVDEWCDEYFDCAFKDLHRCVGVKKDIYIYDRFNSLWPVSVTNKFKKEDKGKIFETTIKEIVDDGIAIRIKFDYKADEYESKMTYAKYVEALKKWFTDPQKKDKKYEDFKDKFGVSIEEAEQVIGKPIMVEVKLAFGKFPYAEIKKPEWVD